MSQFDNLLLKKKPFSSNFEGKLEWTKIIVQGDDKCLHFKIKFFGTFNRVVNNFFENYYYYYFNYGWNA